MLDRQFFIVAFALTLFAPVVFGQATADWQQRVRYEMDVTLHPERHRLDGFQRLTYHNHSPDTLRQVFYHLYFNAFRPGSMMAERNRHLLDPDPRIVPRIWELGPEEIGFHEVLSLQQEGRPLSFEIHDTVMRVALAAPISPGDSTVFEMRFRSQVPLQTRRSGRDSREGIAYSMTQWYPKMAAYDARGWHPDPYVGREFYAPFGTFDVRLHLPARFVIGATGVLQNPGEIGYGYGADTTGVVASNGADTLAWHFYAEDVHDFAWVADPEYIHESFDADGITIHLLYEPEVAGTWTRLRGALPGLVAAFNERFGRYPYPQFTVAQAGDGGMEYPMMTLVSGFSGAAFDKPRSFGSVLGTTAHEFGHMWYYGVLGSNEADFAWMDEGFATYASTEALAASQGRPASHLGSAIGFLLQQHLGLQERTNTPADWFTTNTGYGIASYSTGSLMADMLGYVVSDSLRDRWLHEYFERFKFRHPDPLDVEKVAEDVSGLRLDWFFEQFTNTTRRLDYAVEDLDQQRTQEGTRVTLVLEREEELVMPLDLRLTLEDGTTQWVHVPLDLTQGHKPVPADWIVAAPWPWTFPRYTLTLTLPQPVKRAEIDPFLRTPDENRLNNTTGFPLAARFLHAPGQSWSRYSVGYRPLAQYADDFGPAVGFQMRGQYLFEAYRTRLMLKLWPQVLFSSGDDPHPTRFTGSDGSFFDGIDYEIAYETFVEPLGPLATLGFSAAKHLGVMENRLAFTRPLGRFPTLRATKQRLEVALVHQYNPSDRVFATRAFGFNPFTRQHLLSARVGYHVAHGGDRIGASLEVGGSLKASPASASRFTLDAVKRADLGRFKGRAQFRFGLGAEALAFHKRFILGSSSIDEQWRHDAFRSAFAVFAPPLEEPGFAAFAGAGPVAYLLDGPETGTGLLAGTLALSSGPLAGHPWLGPLRVEAFSGIGQTWATGDRAPDFTFDRFLADAGLGLSYNVAQLAPLQRWIEQSDVLSGLHLAAKFPVWVSDPELIDPADDPLAFRWRLGLRIE